MESDNKVKAKPESAPAFFKSKRFWLPALGIGIGGIGGFIYYHFIGCTSGTCPITSNPYGSIAAGTIFGFLLTGLVKSK
jgi:hypothetical protein